MILKLFSQSTLRQMLTLPYVGLVLVAALIIGILSYQAGRDAVDTLSDLVLNETVNRIALAVDKHISGSEAVLETAFPADIAAPKSIEGDLEDLRVRLWLATTIHRFPNNYAYYGDRRGEFIGLWRYSDTEAELRLQTDTTSPRTIYQFSRINGALQDPASEPTIFDPRERPWYSAGQNTDTQTWTAIYIDFKTLELVVTRARRVNDKDGQFEGVVATDMSLQHLNDFLKTLALSENGVAFIVERDGNILATSRGPHLRKGVDDNNTRLNATHSDDALIAATYLAVSELARKPEAAASAQTTVFVGPDDALIQAGYAHLQDAAGLDWIVAVAVPRQDFLHKVTRNVKRTAALAFTACALIVLLGLIILNRISEDLRQLAGAARAMGDGNLSASIPVQRNDEIGELAKSFVDLKDRLLTDRLTGIANREAIIRRFEDRIIGHRRDNNRARFALLFIDLNNFKSINDRFGHSVGDQVLIEVAERLTMELRADDTAARYGGDEFIVLLNEVKGRSDVKRVCEQISASLQQPYEAISALPKTAARDTAGASIGFALFPDDGQDIETLLKHADQKMYATKDPSRHGEPDDKR